MALLKNRMLVLFLVGLAIIGQSVLWEYVRVQRGWRADRFIISPWSIRGYETAQGLILLAGAITLGVLGYLVVRGVIKATRAHAAIVAAVIVAFAAIAPLASGARPTVAGGFGVILMSALAASLVTVLAMQMLRTRLPSRLRGLTRLAIWVVSLLVAVYFVAGPLFGSEARPAWLVLGVFFGLIAALMVARPPEQIGSYRLLLVGASSLLVLAVTMSTAVRLTLQRLQFELWEVSADRIEIQVTWGIILAWIGGLLAFVGAVGLWAKSRDEITARGRARRQQAAARESEEELAGVTG